MTVHASVPTPILASLLHYSPPGDLRLASILFVVLLRVTATEASSRSISRDAIWALCILAVLRLPPWPALAVAAIVGTAVPLAARAASSGGMGWGDVRLCWALHLCAGPVTALAGVLAASLVALCVAAYRLAQQSRPSCEAGIAFGPYLIAGVIGAVLVEHAYAF